MGMKIKVDNFEEYEDTDVMIEFNGHKIVCFCYPFEKDKVGMPFYIMAEWDNLCKSFMPEWRASKENKEQYIVKKLDGKYFIRGKLVDNEIVKVDGLIIEMVGTMPKDICIGDTVEFVGTRFDFGFCVKSQKWCNKEYEWEIKNKIK